MGGGVVITPCRGELEGGAWGGGRGGGVYPCPWSEFQNLLFLVLRRKPCRCWYFTIVFCTFLCRYCSFKPSSCHLSPFHLSYVPVSRPCLSSGVVVRFIFIYYLMFCSVPRVRKLLKAGVNVNASDGATSDNKALHWAVSYGNADIVKLLCGRFIFYIFQNMSSLHV